MESLPVELIGLIATNLDFSSIYATLQINKEINAKIISNNVLGLLLHKALRRWNFVSALIKDPNLSAKEKIQFQLQRKNAWFAPDFPISQIRSYSIKNIVAHVDGERLVVVSITEDGINEITTINLQSLEIVSRIQFAGLCLPGSSICKGGYYFSSDLLVIPLNKTQSIYKLEEIIPSAVMTMIYPDVMFDTVIIVSQTQCAILDLQKKQMLVCFTEPSRSMKFPGMYIADPITAQPNQAITIDEHLPKKDFQFGTNKIAFLSETTGWDRKQSLVVIETDQRLHVQHWHSINIDTRFAPHTIYVSARFVALVGKREVQVFDLKTDSICFRRKFTEGPPVHTVRLMNNYFLLLSDYALEIITLDTGQSALFEDNSFHSIVAVTHDLVFLSTDDLPTVIDMKTNRATKFGEKEDHFQKYDATHKPINSVDLEGLKFIGANEQQLIFASRDEICILDIERTS